MTTVHNGWFLIDSPPVRDQFREERRSAIKPVIVVHTAENNTFFGDGATDRTAFAVAKFIQTRASAGSYHVIVDRVNVLPCIPFTMEAYGDASGSNRWAIHISIAMASKDWPVLSAEHRDEYIASLVAAVRLVNDWLVAHGYPAVMPRRLTKTQSEAPDANGFISHGDRDPGRRSDPGSGFPWDLFFSRLIGPTAPPPPVEDGVRSLQAALGVAVDGIVGPITRAALEANWCGYRPRYDSQLAALLMNRSAVVQWLQHRMNVLYGANLAEDGALGPVTDHAIRVFLKPGGVVCSDSFLWLT